MKNKLHNPLLEQLRKEISEEDKQYVNAHIQALDLLEDYKEQFRAEVIRRLEEEKHEHPLDSHKELRNDILEEAIEIVKSVK